MAPQAKAQRPMYTGKYKMYPKTSPICFWKKFAVVELVIFVMARHMYEHAGMEMVTNSRKISSTPCHM